MKAHYTARLLEQYAKAPAAVQKAFDKQVRLLLANLRHPSLHAKKYDEGRSLWQARVTRDWRCYFTVQGDTYVLLDLIPHPK